MLAKNNSPGGQWQENSSEVFGWQIDGLVSRRREIKRKKLLVGYIGFPAGFGRQCRTRTVWIAAWTALQGRGDARVGLLSHPDITAVANGQNVATRARVCLRTVCRPLNCDPPVNKSTAEPNRGAVFMYDIHFRAQTFNERGKVAIHYISAGFGSRHRGPDILNFDVHSRPIAKTDLKGRRIGPMGKSANDHCGNQIQSDSAARCAPANAPCGLNKARHARNRQYHADNPDKGHRQQL